MFGKFTVAVVGLAVMSGIMLPQISEAALLSTSTHGTNLFLASPQCIPQDDSIQAATSGDSLSISTSCNVQNNTTIVSNSAQARAEIGNLGVSAISSLSTGSNPGSQFSASTRAIAQFTDAIEVFQAAPGGVTAVLDGFVRLVFDLDGSMTLNSPFDAFSWGEFVNLELSVGSAGPHSGNVLNFRRDLTFNGFTESGNLTADVPIIRGFATPHVLLGVQASCGGVIGNTQGVDCLATSSFFNSATIQAAQVFDSNDVRIASPILQSESGFNYLEGFVKSTSVPEPASILLFGLGLAGLVGFGQRRRRQV